MKTYYYVFWIPTIFHIKPTLLHPEETTKSENISDDNGVDHFVSVHYTGKGFDIASAPSSEASVKTSVFLEIKDLKSNGLLYCSCKINESALEAQFIGEKIPNAIYHIIKAFYHKHEFHEDGEDSLLEAFCSERPIVLDSPDNDALVHYLKLYERKFRAYSKQISIFFSKASEAFITNPNDYRIYNKILHFISDEMCDKALGESIYCNTLLNSKHNCSCRVSPRNETSKHSHAEAPARQTVSERPITDRQKDSELFAKTNKNNDLYKIAFNIQNALEDIRLIKQKCSTIFQNATLTLLNSVEKITESNASVLCRAEESLEKGNRLAREARRITWISLIVALISIGITVYTVCKPEIELTHIKGIDKKQNELMQEVNRLKDELNSTRTVLQFNIQKMDSLPNMLKEMSIRKMRAE